MQMTSYEALVRHAAGLVNCVVLEGLTHRTEPPCEESYRRGRQPDLPWVFWK